MYSLFLKLQAMTTEHLRSSIRSFGFAERRVREHSIASYSDATRVLEVNVGMFRQQTHRIEGSREVS